MAAKEPSPIILNQIVPETQNNNNISESARVINLPLQNNTKTAPQTSQVKFICGSKNRICGSDKGVLICTYLTIIIPTLSYAVVVIPIYSAGGMAALYIFLFITFVFCLFSLIDVSSTNPGFEDPGLITREEFLQMDNKIVIKNETFELKFCDACKIVRQPRSFHCSTCGSCVRTHDHHCPFIGNCVGERNLGKFFLFLLSTFLHCANILIGCSYIFAYNRTSGLEMNYRDYFAIIILVIAGMFGLISLIMTGMHVHLITYGKTTNEYLRNKYNAEVYNEGCRNNWRRAFMCGMPQTEPENEFRLNIVNNAN